MGRDEGRKSGREKGRKIGMVNGRNLRRDVVDL